MCATPQRKLAKLRTTAQTLQSYAYLIVAVTGKLLAAMSEFVEFLVLVLALAGCVRTRVVYRVVQLWTGFG